MCKLQSVFQQWKNEHGNITPTSYRFSRGLGSSRKIRFEDALPYECADQEAGVTDYVKLLSLLLTEYYQPLIELADDEDYLDLLVLSCFVSVETVDLSSLVLCVQKVWSRALQYGEEVANYRAGLKMRAPAIRLGLKNHETLNNNKHKQAGADANKKKAALRDAMIFEAAVSYFKSNKRRTNQQCAEFLSTELLSAEFDLNPGTILKKLSGCKDEALRQLDEEKILTPQA
jgi:hypothetical protein